MKDMVNNKTMTEAECKEEGLRVLDETDRVCKELGLQYFLAYGTLLGAIRHKGYIPWDDDIDIWMKRHDFEILVREFNNHARDGFKLLFHTNTPNYRCSFPKITSSRTKVKEKHLADDNGTGIWVDVFVLDYIDKNSRNNTDKLITLEHRRGLSLYHTADFSMKMGLICSYLFRKGTKLKDFNTPTSYFVEEMTKLHANEKYEEEMRAPISLTDLKIMMKSRWFEESMYMPFENREYPVPVMYDELLKACYGDYMKLPSLKDQKKAQHMTDAEWIG